MMKNLFRSMVLTALGCYTLMAQAVLIDTFSQIEGPLRDRIQSDGPAGTEVASQFGPFYSSNTIGGYRDLYLEITQNTYGDISKTSVFDTGVLSISNDDGVRSMVAVTWDGSHEVGTGLAPAPARRPSPPGSTPQAWAVST